MPPPPTRQPEASGPSRILGSRVLLRRPVEDDAEELLALRKASWEFLRPWEPRPPRGQTGWSRSWFESFLEGACVPGSRRFLICSREEGAVLGAVGLSGIVRGALHGAWLGYWIGEAHSGRGFATEGVDLCLRFAFRSLKLHRVEANVRPENAPSLALVQRLGFRREGFSPSYLRIAGKWCDHERWALLADEWKSSRSDAPRRRAGRR